MQILRSSWLVLLATLIGVVLWWFRPGGIEGPRAPARPIAGTGFDHSPLTAVLSAVIDEQGRVDYGKLRAHPADLDQYLGQLRAVSPENAGHRFKGDDDRLAYYLNAYHAFTLAALRERCPVENLNTLYPAGGFFWRISFLMGESAVTLSDVEGLIRTVQRRDPHVHFALNKGAAGFGPHPRRAFEGPTVREQMAQLAREALALPQFVRTEGETLRLSTLFEWYAQDFGDVRGYIERTRPGTVAGSPEIAYEPFDWSLNGHCGPSAP